MATPRPWYATNAKNLLEGRRNGYTPDGPVVVTLVGGDYPYAADTLYLREDMPLERMDWRMLVDVVVHVWADRTVPLAKVLRVVDDIAHARPRLLYLRFGSPDAPHEIEVGDGLHFARVLDIPAEHSFSWCPFNLTGSATGAKLRRSLLAQHPAMTRL